VQKKDRGTRYTVDYRRVNPVLADDAYAMPSVKEEMAKLEGSEIYWKLDKASGYLQYRLEEEGKEATATRATKGILVMDRLAMGLKPAPAIYNRRLREDVVDELSEKTRRRLAHYMDDLARGAKGETKFEEAYATLAETLAKLEEKGMVCRLKKCAFMVPEMEFLGYKLQKGGLYLLGEERTAAVLRMGDPTTKSELRRLLGMANRYRPRIPRYDKLTAELYQLTGKGGKFDAKDARGKNLCEQLRRAIAKATALKLPNEGPYAVFTDASGQGIGAVLEQDGQPVWMASRALEKAERGYEVFDRELLAVDFAVDKFMYYLAGRKDATPVYTDHEDLKNAESRAVEDKTGRRGRALERIKRVRVEIKYLPKELMVVPDALSKSPVFYEKAREEEMKGRKGKEEKKERKKAEEKETERKEREEKVEVEEEREGEWRSVEIGEMVAVVALKEDPKFWREKQMEDEELRQLIEWLEEGKLPEDEKAARRTVAEAPTMTVTSDGVLYYMPKQGKKSAEVAAKKKLAVPRGAERPRLINEYCIIGSS
jgi:hypothetical protein